jgi:hypothetical protein
MTEGKAVIELSLSQSGKGDAVRWLRSSWGTEPLVLYLGDKVGAGPTRAPYRVPTEHVALGVLALLSKRRVLIAGSDSSRERACRADA